MPLIILSSTRNGVEEKRGEEKGNRVTDIKKLKWTRLKAYGSTIVIVHSQKKKKKFALFFPFVLFCLTFDYLYVSIYVCVYHMVAFCNNTYL